MYKKVLFVIVSVVLFLANTGAAFACLWSGYQPSVPKSLLK